MQDTLLVSLILVVSKWNELLGENTQRCKCQVKFVCVCVCVQNVPNISDLLLRLGSQACVLCV